MKIITVGQLREEAKRKEHNLPDLGILGDHMKTGLHGGAFMYGPDKVLKVSPSTYKERFVRNLPWLKRPRKHVARLINYGDFGDGYWSLLEYVPHRLTNEEEDAMNTVERAARYRRDPGANGCYRESAMKIKKLGPSWQSLFRSLKQMKFFHRDLHFDNIRKSNDQTIKLIDLESFIDQT